MCNNRFIEFLLNKGLYETIKITEESFDEFCDFLDGKVNIDVYCTACKTNRVFKMKPLFSDCKSLSGMDWEKLGTYLKIQNKNLKDYKEMNHNENECWNWFFDNKNSYNKYRQLMIKYYCAMDSNHSLVYCLEFNGNNLMKIGQFPSIADLSYPEVDKYKSIIKKEDLSDLKRAVGLHAQGIGAGSYVYLRRILENTLLDIHTKNPQMDQSDFEKLRINEKITKLKTVLPSSLTQNKQLYDILSKGIHELSENECNEYFNTCYKCILLILEDLHEKFEKEKLENEINNSISNIATRIKQ